MKSKNTFTFTNAVNNLDYTSEHGFLLKHQLQRLDILFKQHHSFINTTVGKLNSMNPDNVVTVKFKQYDVPTLYIHLAADKMFVASTDYSPDTTEDDIIAIINNNEVKSISYS